MLATPPATGAVLAPHGPHAGSAWRDRHAGGTSDQLGADTRERTMRELDWFDGDERDEKTAPGNPPRKRLLIVLAAVPWLLVATILALPLRGEQTPDQGAAAGPGEVEGTAGSPIDQLPPPAMHDDTTDDDTTDDASAAHRTTGDDTEPALLALEELRGRWRVAGGEEELAALAVVLARAHLTGIGPGLAVDGADPPAASYAEHLVVEAVEHPSPVTAVVTVLAILLIDDDPEPSRVELRRLAVPLTTGDDTPAIAGQPWELPPPPLPVAASVDLEPVEDPSLIAAADTALAVAGLGAQHTTALATAPGWPLVATTTDPEGEEHAVWLRRHLDGLVVAGSTLAGASTLEEEQP